MMEELGGGNAIPIDKTWLGYKRDDFSIWFMFVFRSQKILILGIHLPHWPLAEVWIFLPIFAAALFLSLMFCGILKTDLFPYIMFITYSYVPEMLLTSFRLKSGNYGKNAWFLTLNFNSYTCLLVTGQTFLDTTFNFSKSLFLHLKNRRSICHTCFLWGLNKVVDWV